MHLASYRTLSYVHSLMSFEDLGATINPYSKSKISEDQTILSESTLDKCIDIFKSSTKSNIHLPTSGPFGDIYMLTL